MAKSKLIDEVIQEDVQISQEVAAEVKKAVASKDEYALPELKEKDIVVTPGHATRAFRE